jgi:hypothetical protein
MSQPDRPEKSYGSKDAAAIAGATYRQLDYWVRKGLVVPSIEEADGYGSRRRFSLMDIRRIRVVVEAIAGGCKNPVSTLSAIRSLTLPSRGYAVIDQWTHEIRVIETSAAARKLAAKIGAAAMIIPIK